ncbi:MAG: hypothetical protein QF717_02245 [SAR202 cluster bacterium]|jgi:hypothetical protein|nr:hypothetical protein [SAR202 cluster bacterium]MDP7102925.1 hypothetical protein [SAR202 cluster bacterium]
MPPFAMLDWSAGVRARAIGFDFADDAERSFLADPRRRPVRRKFFATASNAILEQRIRWNQPLIDTIDGETERCERD